MPDAVMEHLMYHKALFDSDIDIDYYINLVNDLKDGVHLTAKNPVDKAITMVFELVMQERINPWKIDMKRFVSLYMDRLKKESDVDFIIAGKIVYMAWNILMKKSEQVMDKIQDNVEVDMFGMDFEEFDFDSYAPSIYEESPPDLTLTEPVRREETRPVSLYDLIEAIHEVKIKVEKKKKKRKLREKFKFNLVEKVHKEDLEEEIKSVWERLSEIKEEEVPFSLVYDGTREDFITVFISLLFLEKFGKVELQQYVPYDEIYIRIKKTESENHEDLQVIPKMTIEQL